jgi:amidase
VIYEDNRPTRDADCVMRARAAGAVVMGKTNTTEFAWAFPTVTRNPHDPARTPGGSSSGSAAAVGDGMVPLAFGTQTGGSTLRPSAFCGVVGFKPTHGRHNVAGVKPLSPLSDTLGLHGVTVEDVALLDHALLQLPGDIAAFTGRKPLRVGLCRTASWDVAEPYVKERLMEAADLLRAESIEIAEAEVPPEWAELLDICFPLMEGDGARTLAWEYENHRDLISPVALAQLERGRAMSDKALAALKERKAAYAAALDAFVGGYDVLLTPSAPGEAPVGLNSTGSSAFNRVWTAAQVPCITLPSGRELSGMPIAVQLVARRSQDQALLAHAKFVADALARAGLN